MPSVDAASRPIRAAILGTGSVARLHAEVIEAQSGAELVAVADRSLSRAEEFASIHGDPVAYESLEVMLSAERIDVLHLCTPPGDRAGQAAAGFAAGAHVITEKPPALSLAELDTMSAAADTAGKELAVVFQQRTGSAAARVKRLLDDGAFGRVLLATCNTLWFRGPEYFDVAWRGRWETEGGGTTLSHGIHQIDLLAHLLGAWHSASAQLWRQDRDVETEDLSTGTILFESGAVASVITSVVSPRETSSIRIDTERATIELDHLYGHGHANWRVTPARGVPADEVASWAFAADERQSGHGPLIEAVYAAIADGSPLPDAAAHPARALEIVAALYSSTRDGRVIRRSDLADPSMRGAFTAVVQDNRP